MSTAETIQLLLAIATLPVAVYFIWLYSKPGERWWRSLFGVSLMLLAVAVTTFTLSVVLFRSLGYYPGRDVMIVTSQALTFVAMSLRTFVLKRAQLREQDLGEPRYRRRRNQDIP